MLTPRLTTAVRNTSPTSPSDTPTACVQHQAANAHEAHATAVRTTSAPASLGERIVARPFVKESIAVHARARRLITLARVVLDRVTRARRAAMTRPALRAMPAATAKPSNTLSQAG